MQIEFPTDNEIRNLLPFDGAADYYGRVFSKEEAGLLFERLLNEIHWENDQAMMFGKLIITKRKTAWYGDHAFDYTYSNVTRKALPWTDLMLQLKSFAETKSGATYNSCLLNLYHDNTEGVAWHSDGEKTLKDEGEIASLSFGAERKFSFRHKKTKELIHLVLEHGSLLVMRGRCQKDWLHRLPPVKQNFGPRINLTFRTITL